MGLKTKRISLPCTYRCCSVVVEDYQDGHVGISFESDYLNRQNGRFKRAWKALTDKEIVYAESLNKKEDIIKFLEDTLALLKAPAPNNFDLKVEEKKSNDELKLFGKE